mmetsp:Transcript_17000/g.49112  ORF Transcript_17000/g.49112 Transcript_17000/m.49112 type:complete len:271 (-) Transcript_17000:857-1669(-)
MLDSSHGPLIWPARNDRGRADVITVIACSTETTISLLRTSFCMAAGTRNSNRVSLAVTLISSDDIMWFSSRKNCGSSCVHSLILAREEGETNMSLFMSFRQSPDVHRASKPPASLTQTHKARHHASASRITSTRSTPISFNIVERNSLSFGSGAISIVHLNPKVCAGNECRSPMGSSLIDRDSNMGKNWSLVTIKLSEFVWLSSGNIPPTMIGRVMLPCLSFSDTYDIDICAYPPLSPVILGHMSSAMRPFMVICKYPPTSTGYHILTLQ